MYVVVATFIITATHAINSLAMMPVNLKDKNFMMLVNLTASISHTIERFVTTLADGQPQTGHQQKAA